MNHYCGSWLVGSSFITKLSKFSFYTSTIIYLHMANFILGFTVLLGHKGIVSYLSKYVTL